MKNFNNISINSKKYEQIVDYSLDLIKNGNNIFLLYGNLGAGKTFFTQKLLKQIGVKESITSPTFNLLNTYNSTIGEIYHYDLYRLNNRHEIFELGIEDAMNGKNICIIEWPEIISDLLPQETLAIELGFEDNGERYITLSKTI